MITATEFTKSYSIRAVHIQQVTVNIKFAFEHSIVRALPNILALSLSLSFKALFMYLLSTPSISLVHRLLKPAVFSVFLTIDIQSDCNGFPGTASMHFKRLYMVKDSVLLFTR